MSFKPSGDTYNYVAGRMRPAALMFDTCAGEDASEWCLGQNTKYNFFSRNKRLHQRPDYLFLVYQVYSGLMITSSHASLFLNPVSVNTWLSNEQCRPAGSPPSGCAEWSWPPPPCQRLWVLRWRPRRPHTPRSTPRPAQAGTAKI